MRSVCICFHERRDVVAIERQSIIGQMTPHAFNRDGRLLHNQAADALFVVLLRFLGQFWHGDKWGFSSRYHV